MANLLILVKNKAQEFISFILLAVLRRSVLRFWETHLRVIAPEQHSSFRSSVAVVTRR